MNGNLDISAGDLKYNVSDTGKQIVMEDLTIKNPEMLFIDNPLKEDAPVSPDYLVEVKQDLFSQDFGIENETPIKSQSAKQTNIFDELNNILEKENKKGNDEAKPLSDVSKPEIDDKDEDEDMTLFKKITLFDD